MNKKTTAIIVTIAAALLCVCPGLFSICFGSVFALVSFIPGAEINMAGNSDPQSALVFGLIAMGVGLVFLVIAAVAIFFSWRRKDGMEPATIEPVG